MHGTEHLLSGWAGISMVCGEVLPPTNVIEGCQNVSCLGTHQMEWICPGNCAINPIKATVVATTCTLSDVFILRYCWNRSHLLHAVCKWTSTNIIHKFASKWFKSRIYVAIGCISLCTWITSFHFIVFGFNQCLLHLMSFNSISSISFLK